MKTQDLKLINFIVALNVEESSRHFYAHVHPEIFRLRSIVPKDWEWDDKTFVSTGGFHSITYDNSVYVAASETMLFVAQSHNLEIGDTKSAPDLIIEYVKNIAENTFRKAEIHWSIQAEIENPSGWIFSNFIQPKATFENWEKVEITITVASDTQEVLNVFKFSPNDQSGTVNVDCQSGTVLFADDDDLIRWVSRYRKIEDIMFRNLSLIMGLNNE